MKIFIANVPHKMDEAELKRHLTQFGQVASVKLLVDQESGKRKGFGFIEMPVYDQAQTAIKALNGKEFYGRAIALSEAQERKQEGSSYSRTSRPRKTENYKSTSNEEVDGNRW
jgi:RNA recognition motif-containing protein